MIKASVVVPTFKRVDQTLLTLDLLLASDGLGSIFECEIIISDSTPDDSLKDAVAKKTTSSFPAGAPARILYTKPEKPGIAANKNAGAKAATNPILIFCDSDMEVEKNTLLEAVNSLKNHPRTAAVGGNVFWRGGPKNGEKDRPRLEDRIIMREDTAFIEALYSRFLATYKDVFVDVGGYDEEIFNMRGEGSDLSIRYWRAGYPLSYEELVTVHHVHDVPDAAAVRVDHPEWGIAKDLLLLGYKYDMYNNGYKNFPATVDINFSPLGAEGYYRMLQGIGRHYEDLMAAKPALDAYRAADKPAYDFKFLEVFTDAEVFSACITAAGPRLADIRAEIFG